MNMKSQIAIAGLLFAGLLASGCSQQQAAGEQSTGSAQQTAADVAPAADKVAPVARVNPPVVPRVKAKGNYKGPVAQDAAAAAAMQQYKK